MCTNPAIGLLKLVWICSSLSALWTSLSQPSLHLKRNHCRWLECLSVSDRYSTCKTFWLLSNFCYQLQEKNVSNLKHIWTSSWWFLKSYCHVTVIFTIKYALAVIRFNAFILKSKCSTWQCYFRYFTWLCYVDSLGDQAG